VRWPITQKRPKNAQPITFPITRTRIVSTKLDDLSRAGVEQVGLVGVHERRVVGKPVLGDDLRRSPAGLPARAAKPLDLGPRTAQGLEGPFEVGALLVLGLLERRAVRVRVVTDLVSVLEDRLDGLRVAVGGPARNEERGRQRVLAQ
jgi:hypothetical protein